MKRMLSLLSGALLLLVAAGCGSQDRAALAKDTVKKYWDDIDHARMLQAYQMMSSGNQQNRKFGDYETDMFNFMTQVGNIKTDIGKPKVHDDTAVVPVTFNSPKTSLPLRACQHLFWENGKWTITDQNGGVTSAASQGCA